jgi:uncharacterized protein (TIGR03435 family)
MNHRIAVLIAIPALSSPATRAQSTPAAIPKFEAVSIRPCNTGNGRSPDGATGFAIPASSPGRLSTCRRLAGEIGPQGFEGLIEDAYGKYANGRINPPWTIPKVEGGPTWVWNDPYTIAATTAGAVSEEMMQGPMLQALLEDRFKLNLHRETRQAPVYELVVAKGALKLKRFKEGSCVPVDPAGALQVPRPRLPQGKWCESGITGLGAIHAFGRGITLQAAAYLLSRNLDRPVVDKTGLTGLYDFDLEFARDPSLAGPPPPPPPPGGLPADPSNQPSGPSIFTAVQEELGLKLESAKGPREVLVIDSVQRPSEN